MGVTKPLVKFVEESISEEFTEVISDNLYCEDKLEQELRRHIVTESYQAGVLDGIKLILWVVKDEI